MTTNCIKFMNDNIETAKGTGSISTLSFDLDVTVERINSDNPLAPTHRVLGRSPRGAGNWSSVVVSGRSRTRTQALTTSP